MYGSAHFFVGQGSDDTLDLPPVAESDHISGIAAPFGACSSLEPSVIAEALHEVGSFRESPATGDVGRFHSHLLNQQVFPVAR